MPPRNLPRRTDSELTHVSDSEPEREASRRSFSSDSAESLPATPPTERPPLSALSNTVLGTEPGTWRSLDKRLQAIEGSLAEIKRELHVQRRQKRDNTSLHDTSTTFTPPRKRARVMRSQCVGSDSPVGRLAEPRIHRSSLMASTLDQEEMACSLHADLLRIQRRSLHRPRRQRGSPSAQIKKHRSFRIDAPRFDSVTYDTDDDPLAMGQLQFVFRAHLPSGAKLDLAMIRPFRKTSWHPKTHTDCPVREQVPAQSSLFITLEHVVRGVLPCPIFGARQDMHYVIDCIDEDMYLRLHNID
ncbi:hypothetical protein B0H17DRAFT_1132027 [Mycena rosella]|uniref:Uncharacterized protein n=1 Tax=Mycena rosella TaxID=1033263 RepID=A0AAD7GM93_MYCRO|nr:hypothetical protein B0H17DRAFT_1132027 [Mycena rosella]